MLLILSFVAGVLTVLAPCVLPLLPIIVGGSVGGGTSLKRALTVTASLAVSVIAFTLLIKASTLLITIPQSAWQWVSGIIIIFFGLISVFPKFWENLPFLSRLSAGSNQILSTGYSKQSFWGDVIVGASLGPVFSTCSPTYFLVLAAVLPQSFVLGFIYLVAYALGLSLALLGVAYVGQKILDRVGVAANPHGMFKKIIGVLFICVGLAIITGFDKTLQTKILDAGFFDVTKIEQVLLTYVPQDGEVTTSSGRILAPEISTPDGFVNTDGKPLTLESLRGKVVLLDIWTFSCINCQRTIPRLKELHAKYKDKGLVIVGLHTPEFAFEHVLSNVERAVKDFGIEYPVVLDNDYSTWNAYGNRYWPRKYLIDPEGYIIYDHIGEGGYEETERAVQEALMKRDASLHFDAMEEPIEAETPTSYHENSPEVYFGSHRNEYLANGTKERAGVQTFAAPNGALEESMLYLGGEWDITGEYSEGGVGSSILYRFSAQKVFFVAGSATGTVIDIYQDDVFVKSVTVQEEGLYTLIENPEHGVHTLRIEVQGPALQAFTFTFG